jgi:hypothetical protein
LAPSVARPLSRLRPSLTWLANGPRPCLRAPRTSLRNADLPWGRRQPWLFEASERPQAPFVRARCGGGIRRAGNWLNLLPRIRDRSSRARQPRAAVGDHRTHDCALHAPPWPYRRCGCGTCDERARRRHHSLEGWRSPSGYHRRPRVRERKRRSRRVEERGSWWSPSGAECVLAADGERSLCHRSAATSARGTPSELS